MITLTEIYHAEYDQLFEARQKLIVDKMKLDRFFSVFLDNTDLDESEPGSDDWIIYKEMIKEYERVDHLLATTKYHIDQYV
jgi:UDP-3-O-[3-hydroxymyristoyl] glucosamine N-acyltransferase